MNCYYHHVPGRLRVKVPGLKNNPRLAAKVENCLRSRPEIEEMTINPVTGSIVIRYDSGVTDSRRILEHLADNGFINLEKAVTSGQHINQSAEKIGQSIGKAVFGFCVEKTFGGSAFSLLAALI